MPGGKFLTDLALVMHFFDALLNDLTRPLFIKFLGERTTQLVIPILCSELLGAIPAMLARSDVGRFPGWLEGKADACSKTMLRLGSTVLASTDIEEDEYDPPLDARIPEMAQTKRQRENSAITGAFDALCSLAEWQRCFAPGCQGTVGAAELKKCSNYKRVLYCSPACQQRAWKHHSAPHKDLCKLATLLVPESSLSPRRESAADLDSFY